MSAQCIYKYIVRVQNRVLEKKKYLNEYLTYYFTTFKNRDKHNMIKYSVR